MSHPVTRIRPHHLDQLRMLANMRGLSMTDTLDDVIETEIGKVTAGLREAAEDVANHPS